jgi:hypothetical protein
MEHFKLANLTEAFNISMFVLAAIPFISFYFMPKSYLRIKRSRLPHSFVLGLVFVALMILLEHLAHSSFDAIGLNEPLSESQFFILGTLLLLMYSYYFSKTYCRLLELEIKIVEKSGVSRKLITESLTSAIRGSRGREFRPNWQTFQEERPSYLLPAPFYLNYHVLIDHGHEGNNKSAIVKLGQSPRNAQIYRVLTFVTGAFMLFARAQDKEKPDIRTFVRLENFDAQLWFTVGAIILLLFCVVLIFFGEMAILEMEENYNKAMRGEAVSLALKHPKIPEKPTFDVEEARKKALARLESQRKRAEEEKKKQIENVMGKFPEEEPGKEPALNPEVLRLESLIHEVQSILFSTPPHRVVSAAEVAEKVGGKSTEEEIETVIIGLVRRKEVRGRYDIWTKSYQGGNENEKFIENKLMELTDGDTKNLSRLKIGADGTVEFQFTPQVSKSSQSTSAKSKKAAKDQ